MSVPEVQGPWSGTPNFKYVVVSLFFTNSQLSRKLRGGLNARAWVKARYGQ